VRSSDLSDEQLERLKHQAGRGLRWLNALIRRMDQVGFDPTDKLYLAALRAQDRMQALGVELHYASVRHGVGRSDY